MMAPEGKEPISQTTTSEETRVEAPDLSGHPDWTPIVIPELLTRPDAFVSGDPEGDRLRVKYYHNLEENNLVAKIWFGPRVAGPPNHAHGGSIAAALDEAMGVAALHAGYIVVAATISLSFCKMLPLNSVVSAIIHIDKVEGKKIHTKGQLVSDSGTCYAECEGIFVNIGRKAVEALM